MVEEGTAAAAAVETDDVCVCGCRSKGNGSGGKAMVEILYLTRRAVGALQYGKTALHYAAGKGHDSVVETLWKAEGCDVNAKTDVRI